MPCIWNRVNIGQPTLFIVLVSKPSSICQNSNYFLSYRQMQLLVVIQDLVTWCTLFMVLYLSCMCQCMLYMVLWLHIGTFMHLLAGEPRNTLGLLFPCQYLSGTILVIAYLMVWDWLVSRAGRMPFYWPCCSLPFCLLLLSLAIFSFYGLVLWGLGFHTDIVGVKLLSYGWEKKKLCIELLYIIEL